MGRPDTRIIHYAYFLICVLAYSTYNALEINPPSEGQTDIIKSWRLRSGHSASIVQQAMVRLGLKNISS